jgi:hypothetical protein
MVNPLNSPILIHKHAAILGQRDKKKEAPDVYPGLQEDSTLH